MKISTTSILSQSITFLLLGIVFWGSSKTFYKIILICLLIQSCTSDTKKEENTSAYNDSTYKTLQHTGQKKYSFNLKDSIIEISDTSELVVFRNGFIRNDSSIYNGPVTIILDYLTDSIAFNHNEINSLGNEKELGKVGLKAIDGTGQPLMLNPNYQTCIRFSKNLRLLTDNFRYMNGRYISTVRKFKKLKPIEKNEFFGGYNLSFIIDTSILRTQQTFKSEQEIIANRLTKKYSHFWLYISTSAKKYSEFPLVNIQINYNYLDKIDPKKSVVVLLTDTIEGEKYFLSFKTEKNTTFELSEELAHNDRLPLATKYYIFCYGYSSLGYWYYMNEGVTELNKAQIYQLTPKRVAYSDLLKRIEGL